MVKYYIIIGIIYIIPYIVTIVINCLRRKLETDRNFYGKDIDIQKIELTNVSYKKFEIARNNIKKYTEMGEIKYVYDRSYDFEDERLLLSEKEYQKCFPDKFVKTMVAYYIIFEFSYETDHGKIKAKITLTKPVIEKTYNDKDVEEIKKLIYEECSNKIFANVGTESKYKDYKGQEVIHSLPIRTSTLEGEIIGESNKRPGQYDWMFSDSSWYPEEAKKRNRFLSFCTYLNQNKRNSIYLPYFTIGIYAIYFSAMQFKLKFVFLHVVLLICILMINGSRKATTNIQRIIHILNLFLAAYSLGIIINWMFNLIIK